MVWFYRILIYSTLLSLSFVASCGTGNDRNSSRYFKFTHQNENIEYSFVAKTSNREVIAKVEQELQKPFEDRSMHINGSIKKGNKEYNPNWSWHFVEDDWDLVGISTEVCDGRPSFVEEDLDYWVETVGRFCPWSSRVEEEVNF